MHVSKITSPDFRSKIIDSHAHVGNHEGKIYNKGSLDVFVKSPLPGGDTIEKMIVSDLNVLHGTKDEYHGNLETIKTLANDSKYAVLASCNPAVGDIENIKNLYRNNPDSIIGLKFHPTFQQLAPTDIKYEPYFRFAEEHKIPCLIHTAVNVDNDGNLSENIESFSDPEYIYMAAKKHPQIPFVMAHLGAGWRESHDKAAKIILDSIKNGDADLYADVSWVDIDNPDVDGHSPKDHIVKTIKKLKGIGEQDWKYGDQSYRLLFGTDVPLSRFHDWFHPEAINDYAKFVNDIKFAIQNDSDLSMNSEKIIDDLLFNNAKNLYLKKKNFHI